VGGGDAGHLGGAVYGHQAFLQVGVDADELIDPILKA